MTRRGKTGVLAHCHEEHILVDEKEVDTHCHILLCVDKFSWHRHDIRRFSNRFLSRTVALHLDN